MTRNPALDGLRGLAALLIICTHCGVPGTRVGFSGVDIFFVLSGFLIMSLLAVEIDRTGKIDLGRYYLARTLRLYPPLLIFLIAMCWWQAGTRRRSEMRPWRACFFPTTGSSRRLLRIPGR